jgi:hypothetical protein
VAVVTKRIKALDVAGKRIHQIGVPIHWGFTGAARQGFIANTLTPFVGDANTQTPEFKSFLVNVEKDKDGAPLAVPEPTRVAAAEGVDLTRRGWLFGRKKTEEV